MHHPRSVATVLGVAATLAVTCVALAAPASATRADAATRQDPGAAAEGQAAPAGRVLLVGDSIMLGAAPQLEASFAQAGYQAVVDADESRSTAAGAVTASRRLTEGADAVVVMLGANDAGNPESYRQRVKEVVAATAWVPHLYWMTIPEVRGYYPAANQVVREELALRPGAEVLDWNSVSASGGMTAGDGLHLTPAGANAMAWFVTVNVLEDLAATTTTTTTTTTEPPATTAAPSTSQSPSADIRQTAERAAQTAADSSVWGFATTTAYAFAVVLAVLVILGASLAIWALWRTRGSA